MLKCKICNKQFKRIQWTHLKQHNITIEEYKRKYPNALLEDPSITIQRKQTLDNMINRYGKKEGERRWKIYRDKQADTNSFEYKQRVYGWTYEQFVEYNKSRGSIGEANGNYGKGYYQYWVERYGKEEADRLNAISSKRKGHGKNKGKKLSDEAKENMRYGAITRVKRQNGKMLSYNPSSIPIIEEYGNKNGYTFRHAENGGEVEIAGYLVDGYDKKHNVVIEYYEKFHYTKGKIKKDKIRQQKIQDTLNCKFVVINYNGTITEYDKN